MTAAGERTYTISQGVSTGLAAGRLAWNTPQGGAIVTDATLLAFWQRVQGRTLSQILAESAGDEHAQQSARAALACLCQAGLLTRQPDLKPPAPQRPPQPAHRGPLVSIILVGHNSRSWLETCLASLASQTYAPIEIIVVDNASSDDSLTWLAEAAPQARTLRLETLQPLARAINLGIAQAAGEYFLLLNPDVHLQADALFLLVAVANRLPDPIVVPKLRLMWAPGFLNGLGNSASPSRPGTDTALGHLDFQQFDHWTEVASACFAAVLISRSAWEKAGPLDESFEMYFEDVEWSYRARLYGLHISLAPQAVIYHALGSRSAVASGAGLAPRKQRNVSYGQLRFFARIAGRSYPGLLARNLIYELAGLARSLLHLDGAGSAARLRGWLDFARELPALRRSSRQLQKTCRITDGELFSLQRNYPQPLVWHGLPELTWDLVRHHYLPLLLSRETQPVPEFTPHVRADGIRPSPRPRLLIISHDIVAEKMAGPGMRYLEMARTLSDDLEVTLAVPAETTLQVPGLRLVSYALNHPDSLRQLVDENDILLISAYLVDKFPFLGTLAQRLVVDLYDPFVLENLYYYKDEPRAVQDTLNHHSVQLTNQLARLGDFFICGNERQRDYWLGVLTANGRTNPAVFAQDDSLRSLIDVVGVGIPCQPPLARPLLRGQHPLIPQEARVVLWGGGIWDWLDPLTLVRAWPAVLARHPQARLVFLGTRHPNALVPLHIMAHRAEQLAAEIGEKDRTILFFDWLSYTDREALLAEADIAALLHPLHIETRFSIRTRVLDALWARLPILITAGDVTSEWVEQHGIGRVIPPFDEAAAAQALGDLLDQPKGALDSNFDRLHEIYQWPKIVQPLRQYCLHGAPAADQPRRASAKGSSLQAKLPWYWRFSRAWFILRREGLKALLQRLGRYIQWRILR